MSIMQFELTAIGTVVSLALGVWNAYRTLAKDRVKLRVKLSASFRVGDKYSESSTTLVSHQHVAVVEVANLSSFPISLAGIEFVLRDGQRRAMLMRADRSKRLEPRESHHFWSHGQGFPDNIKQVVVTTQCGRSTAAKIPLFKHLRTREQSVGIS